MWGGGGRNGKRRSIITIAKKKKVRGRQASRSIQCDTKGKERMFENGAIILSYISLGHSGLPPLSSTFLAGQKKIKK
jgi:hypothetical protein